MEPKPYRSLCQANLSRKALGALAVLIATLVVAHLPAHAQKAISIAPSEQNVAADTTRVLMPRGWQFDSVEELERIFSERGQRNGRDFVKRSIKHEPLWLRLELHNPTSQTLVRNILFEQAAIVDVELVMPTSTGVERQRNGTVIPIAERQVQSRLPVFRVTSAPGERMGTAYCG